MIAVGAIHAALLFALLHLSGRIDLADPQSVLRTFDVFEVPPPPPVQPPPPRKPEKAKPKQKEGGSAPKNIKSEATPVVAPKPKVEPLLPNPVVVAEVPRQGADATQGASDVRGPGTGAGGIGNGSGIGLGGNGPGGGGDGGVAVEARLLTPRLGGRDFPRALLDAWPRGAPVFLGLRIEVNGAVSQCKVFRTSGVPAIDSETCGQILRKFRFQPAFNRFGQPVASWKGYVQAPVGR
ncbi:MAG: energy transducer TonB [Sphingomicrobium sp.]